MAAPIGGAVAVGEDLRRDLETLLEVEWGERAFFEAPNDPLEPELSRAVRGGDEDALSAFLALARTVGGADLAYWGAVSGGVLSVGWHVGARKEGFGFDLPVGKGVGGSAFARSEPIDIADYLNCRFRYPGVADVTDDEGVRSTLAIPARGEGPAPAGGAVLYAVRRTIAPFTEAQKALLLRLKGSVEPVSWPVAGRRAARSGPAARPGDDGLRGGRSRLREMLLGSAQVRDVESWLEEVSGGPAVAVDGEGRPYALSNADRLERLRRSGRPSIRAAMPDRGALEMWPARAMPPEGWPDLLEDAATACAVVVDRAERARERTDDARTRWLRSLAEGSSTLALRREGDRLGLPTDRGEVWAFGWGTGAFDDSGKPRQRMLAEDVALERLKAPLTLLGETGVVLLRGPAPQGPERVRDELLRYFGSSPVWLVHGAGYDSFEGLRTALCGAVSRVEQARREGEKGPYVLKLGGEGLDGLLENPRLSDELSVFADGALKPLLDHDASGGGNLTETFCRALASGSTAEAARRLFVHENTVRYRMRRAEAMLGKSLASPKERTALALAAFVWLRRRGVGADGGAGTDRGL